MVLMLAIMAPRPASAADLALQLAVRVNTYAIDAIGAFVLRDGVLMALRSELIELGFQVPGGPDRLIALSELKLLVWHLDVATQTLDVTTPDAGRLPARLAASPPEAARAPIESGTGVTLNYDLGGTSVAGRSVGSGLFDLRAFSPWGVASTGMLGYLGGGPDGPGVNFAVRLDSTYTYSDVDALSRYRGGDFITGSLGWTRAIRLGGVQFTSDFALRPDLVTFPLPSIGGRAVDLGCAGQRQPPDVTPDQRRPV
jgi:outer membrane usher protein